TLFLDELGDMPLTMQAKLLRVLEDSKVRRLGGRTETPVDVRVMAATNRPVNEALSEKAMREDLYYRLNVFQIHLPPLRNRKEDIPGLVETIVSQLNQKHDYKVAHVHPDTLERLASHSWPGNIRELRNVLERAMILARDGTLLPEHLPRNFTAASPIPPQAADTVSRGGVTLEPGQPLRDLEKTYILMTLKSSGNNKTLAAKRLGISLRTLHNRLNAFAAEDARAEGRSTEGKSALAKSG